MTDFEWCWASLQVFIGHLGFLVHKMSFHIFCPFPCSFMFIWGSSLYILISKLKLVPALQIFFPVFGISFDHLWLLIKSTFIWMSNLNFFPKDLCFWSESCLRSPFLLPIFIKMCSYIFFQSFASFAFHNQVLTYFGWILGFGEIQTSSNAVRCRFNDIISITNGCGIIYWGALPALSWVSCLSHGQGLCVWVYS